MAPSSDQHSSTATSTDPDLRQSPTPQSFPHHPTTPTMNSQAPPLPDHDHVMANLEQIWNDLSLEHSHDETMSFFRILVEEDKIWDKAWRVQQAHVHRPTSTGPKKVEPILCLGPWQNEGPDLPTKFQKTCSTRMRLALQGKETGPHYYKKTPTSS